MNIFLSRYNCIIETVSNPNYLSRHWKIKARSTILTNGESGIRIPNYWSRTMRTFVICHLLHPHLVHSDGFELRSDVNFVLLPFSHCNLIILNRLEAIVLPSTFLSILDFWLNLLHRTPASTIIDSSNLVETF